MNSKKGQDGGNIDTVDTNSASVGWDGGSIDDDD